MPTMGVASLCLLLQEAHEYPVLDRRPGSNDLELDFRWVCAVSCARISFLAYRIGESVDLPVHGKPYLSPQCMDDFRFSDVT